MFLKVTVVVSLLLVAACQSHNAQGQTPDPELALKPAPQPGPPNGWWLQRHESILSKLGEHKDIDILFVGDSITQGWEGAGKAVWDKHFADSNALNLGFSGDRTEHVLWRIEHSEVDGLKPRWIVVMIGTNNAGHRSEPSEFTAAGVRKILDELQSRMPDAKILLHAIFPRGETPDDPMRQLVDGTNRLIQEFADGQKIIYLDIGDNFLDENGNLPADVMPDFLHPNERGYEIWAEGIADRLKE